MAVSLHGSNLAFWTVCWGRSSQNCSFHLSRRDFSTICGKKVDCQGALATRNGIEARQKEYEDSAFGPRKAPICEKCREIAAAEKYEIVSYNVAWKTTKHSPHQVEMEVM